jgi:S-DNA-T family DNA segregation ATPase FtsK/SpoIIIE
MAKRRNKSNFNHSQVIMICLILLAIIFIAFQRLGFVGEHLDQIINFFFGVRRDILYASFSIYLVYRVFIKKKPTLSLKHKIIIVLTFIVLFVGTSYFSYLPNEIGFDVLNKWLSDAGFIYSMQFSSQGGLFGVALYSVLTYLLDRIGTLILLSISLIILFLLSFNFSFVSEWFSTKRNEIKNSRESYSDEDNYNEPVQSKTVFLTPDEPTKVKTKFIDQEVKTKSAATIHKIGNYTLPSLNVLDEVVIKNKSNANTNAANQKGRKLIEILGEFGVNASLVGTHIGPAVTKFEVRPDSNIKISKIASLQDNIKMELAAKELRLEAPIPGRNAVGIEIPNVEMIPVRMIELMRDISPDKQSKKLLFPLGKDLMGKSVYAELDKMPHLLIAGATGSGKSVCVNSIIINFLLRTSPNELKLVLVDPKKVEFTPYHKIPHLISPVISDAAEAARALKVIVMMMENRYEIFSKVGVRNIQTYNDLLQKNTDSTLEPMPWIVVIIDELADLMIVAGKEVEASIQRITQLARAAGIHLIVATQRPSTDVITGIIKANIPSRIAFAVSSGIDSRTIIDGIGAERLLGYGDMLFCPVGEPAPIRVQGVYVTDEEIRRVTDFVNQQQKPQFDDAFLNLNDPEAGSINGVSSEDPIYEEVKNYIIETGRASTSNIQRRFGLGYNRAARLIDILEEQGVVGPAQGSKPRDVYYHK